MGLFKPTLYTNHCCPFIVAVILRGLDALTTEDSLLTALAKITSLEPKNCYVMRNFTTGVSMGYAMFTQLYYTASFCLLCINFTRAYLVFELRCVAKQVKDGSTENLTIMLVHVAFQLQLYYSQ